MTTEVETSPKVSNLNCCPGFDLNALKVELVRELCLGMVVVFVLQYFLWARWLYPIVMRMEADSDAKITAAAGRSATITPESDR